MLGPAIQSGEQEQALEADEDTEDSRRPAVRERTAEDAAAPKAPARGKTARGSQPLSLDEEDGFGAASPDAPVVKAVEITGATPLDAKKAQRVLTTREGEALNPVKQREDLRRLYDLGIFKPSIQILAENVAGGVKLRYHVEPNPKVGQISVNGNSQVTTKRIVSELPVKAGETYTIQAQNKIRETITRFYGEKGFNSAAVRVEERPAASGTVDLAIYVDEGTKMKIKDLVIRGNKNVSNLAIQLRAANKGSWGPFTHYFNESQFEQDLEKIRGIYRSKGYLDAEVRRGDFLYAPDHSWVSPVIDVQEGPRYRVGQVEARGYTLFSREEVLGPFQALRNNYYSVPEFAKASEKVKNLYGDEGFLLCRVEPDFRKDPSRGVVDVDVDVSEGPRIYVGNVRVVSQSYPEEGEGNWLRRFYSRLTPPVKDEVVQREVRMQPGQVYRRFDEVKTRDRLKSLNVFDDVSIHHQLTNDSNVRDCVVEVSQCNTGSLLFGVGFGDIEGAFAYANYVEHNLFGMARDLRVATMIGSRATSFDISYLDRYFLGYDLAAQFSLFHHSYVRNGDLVQTDTGASAEFTRPLSECVKDSWKLRLANVSFDLDDDEDRPRYDIDDYLAATIRYRLVQDTRDDCFFPTSGNILAGSVEAGSADGLLLKFEGQYASYYAVNDAWVLASNTQVGFLPYKARKIGYAERFFMGGSRDLRGFRVFGAGPFDPDNDDIPLGGATKLLTQLELRHPFADCLTGVLFTDIGMLSERPLGLGSPRMSIGTGVRFKLPVAQVALDLGVPVLKKDKDQTQILHFTLTSAF